MDFFGAQDRARRRTWQLGALFVAAVIGLVVATNLLIVFVAHFTSTPGWAQGFDGALSRTAPETWLGVSALVVFTIAAASFYKHMTLRSGGRAVAELLGGRPIDPATVALEERRLLNVVEEMALAAGLPVPPVYLLDEEGINAFAAGLGTSDAVIGVTRGALTHLDREELQGVVGHEFSHILNGDARINHRLVAILHGILFLGIVGEMLLRGRGRGRHGRNGLPIAALGLGLLLIGYAGTFFGNLIKAAVNRQREFLADAAAVQFTRNPAGIADALKKIGGSDVGSELRAAHSREASHFFFGQAVRFALGGLLATHPPVGRRIRALEPGWDGRYLPVPGTGIGGAGSTPDEPAEFETGTRAAETPTSFTAFTSRVESAPALLPPTIDTATSTSASAEAIVAQVGQLPPDSLPAARSRIRGLPESVVEAVHETASAHDLVQALFLARDRQVRSAQMRALERLADTNAAERVELRFSTIRDLDEIQRLTLLTLAAPTLKRLSLPQYRRLLERVEALATADAQIDLQEWVQHRVLLHELGPHFGTPRAGQERRLSPADEDAAVASVLAAIAHAASPADGASARAFAAGAAGYGRPLALDSHPDRHYQRLNGALRELRCLSPLRKPRIIKACAACALVDGAGTAQRALLAGIAATLDCPLPPDFRLGV